MEVSIKKEIFLANLPCQICRENIINATKRQKGIHSEFDSEQQILNLQYDDQTDYVFLAKEIRNILKDHKHQIRIQESESLFVREYRLENNHWDKLSIEAGIKELSGVKDVSIINHKLHIVSNVSNQKPIIRQIRKLFKGLKISETEEETVSRFDIITLIISFLLFLSALLFNLSTAWEFALFFLAYLLAGYKVIIASIRAILQGRFFEETFLMSIATVGAFIIGEYPEGVAVMLFYCVGEIIQEAALDKSRRSISKLMDLRPDYANLLIDGKTTRVDPENVPIGAMVLVQPGERIPLDGIVLEGTSALDVSALTGEAEFQTIEPGSRVLSGSINTSQVFTIQVDKTYHDSTASKILELVETSASRKAPTEKMITKFSRYYTPVVVIGALILAFVVPLFTDHNFSAWIYRALILLVISCPCALVISIPLGFFGGIGNASRNGILVKGSNYLDALNSLKTIVFDKTGTLTKGSFSIKEIIPASDYTKEEVLSYAILAESHSHHPLARSFTADDLEIPEISSYQEHPGLGIQVQ
ncbi:MAG: HAD-IC family P-type ATPase, partial [Acholeplasmataceae bacterium]|nr:HAD-IC family P-type ATPase [Acholeplasmataceae bacterium]